MLSDIVFKFLDEFFLSEASGTFYESSSNCKKERWKICESCEHFDEQEEGCKLCGCYLPHRIKDPWADCPIDQWISNDEEWNQTHYQKLKSQIIEKYPEYQQLIEHYEQY